MRLDAALLAKPRTNGHTETDMSQIENAAHGSHADAPRSGARRRESWFAPVFGIGVCGLLVWGWLNKAALGIEAERGWGYALGIIGVACMLLLLAYPMRKRGMLPAAFGSVPFWFRFHMTLGVLGPTAILFHARFNLGSLNSNVALFAMLTVAGSGVIGRYFYAKIHRGLYGRRATVRDLLDHATAIRRVLSASIGDDDDLVGDLKRLEALALREPRGPISSAWLALGAPWRARRIRGMAFHDLDDALGRMRRLKRISAAERNERRAVGRRNIRRFCDAVTQACELSFYERLFALWHVLHLPLFFLMVIAAIIHVVSVHLY